ncbi:MAG: hypothetical protein HY815_05955 [Candidatus Riflebacteria bacterium]|nr:hypothetical protein [Candidatus Riflebacteria bacterium]
MTTRLDDDLLERTIWVQESPPPPLFARRAAAAPSGIAGPRRVHYRTVRWMVRICVALFLLFLSGPVLAPRADFSPCGATSRMLPPYVVEETPCAYPDELFRLAAWGSLELPFYPRNRAPVDAKRNARILDRIVAMLDSGSSGPILSVPSGLTATTVPNLLLARGYLRAAMGQPDEAMQSWMAALRCGRLLQQGTPYGPDAWTLILGLNVELGAIRAFRTYLTEGKPPQKHLKLIQTALDRFRAPELKALWRCEIDRMHAVLDEYALSNRLGDCDQELGSGAMIPLRLVLPWMPGRRRPVAEALHARLRSFDEALSRRFDKIRSPRTFDRRVLSALRDEAKRTPVPGPEVTPLQLMGSVTVGYGTVPVATRLLAWSCWQRLYMMALVDQRLTLLMLRQSQLMTSLRTGPTGSTRPAGGIGR